MVYWSYFEFANLPTLTKMTKMFSEDEGDKEWYIQDITIVEERFMVASDWGSDCLRCFDLDIVSQSAQMSFQRRINGGDGCLGIVYSDNKLIVSYDDPHGKVQVLDMDGDILKVFEKNDNGEQLFTKPWGLAVSPDNSTIYVSDRVMGTVTALSQDGRVLSVLKNHDNLRYPTGATIDNAGRMYVCSMWTKTVCMVSQETGTVTKLLGEENGLSYPTSIAHFPVSYGNVFLPNRTQSKLKDVVEFLHNLVTSVRFRLKIVVLELMAAEH
ncbi:hypothetical protein MAR_033300 [Mya arenaria]|uniref:SMP-30/Gluconolactonase/LRE-like region domain-containing protein n=1 Tax=Mya arenaria TaxID=6604 RepID=A0ABY7GBZ3_MYAAR|nr:hypothetical protein MAR_033300 [Mya arenaria]